MMLSIRRSRPDAQGGGLAALEPPVDGEHRLPPNAPWLERKAPCPFETDPAHHRRRPANAPGEVVERAADTDTGGGADGPEVAVEEKFLPAGAERREDDLGACRLNL